MIHPNRREALLAGLFGAGLTGLRALATGLPAWFLMDPRAARADSPLCGIPVSSNLQYLIVSASSAGDALACNAPGTYTAPAVIHPAQPEMAKTAVALGSQSYGAAKPWGTLSAAVRSRTSFFHHATLGNVHGDHPKVMRLMGGTSRSEMLLSAFARHLAPCFGTVQSEPVAVGANGSSLELLSFAGRTLPAIAPTQLRQLLAGSKSPLVALRAIRDKDLDRLNALAKQDGTGVQKQFLDQMAASQAQVRKLSDALGATLSAIQSDDVSGQVLAAAALIKANVTPVVTLHIPFGGDNHTDANLQAEADQCQSGVDGISALMTALAALGLTDQVTFATMNVFGRTLSGSDKVAARAGRDHFGNHCVTAMIGKNVRPGVVGGVTPLAGSGAGTVYGAADIDAKTGAPVAGGDVPRAESHVAAARTLGAALGIPADVVKDDFAATAGGKIVTAAIA